jgi:hypothetical protein
MKERTANTDSAKSAVYGDGHPLDVIQYLEAKLILKPDRLVSLESFREFGKLVARTAKQLEKVDFVPDGKASRPTIREIIFFDTSDCRLYNNAFILRQRVTYVDGFPEGDPEIVLKFRHPEEKRAAFVDVRPEISGTYEIKFKSEVLPLKDQVGGLRVLYSHNCQFGLSQVHEPASAAMAVLTRIFPALSVVKKDPDEKVCLVNQEIVEEVLLPLGQIDFHKGQVAKCDIALWRTRGDHKPLIGEFAFQARFDRREDVHENARKRAEQFFISMQQASQAWLALGCTKTAMVYRLKGNEPQSHE